MDLDSRQIRFSTYFKLIMAVTIIAMGSFFAVESTKIGRINDSLSASMEDIKEQIFMSTYDHLKKGNMELFNQQMVEIGKYRGIIEYTLLDAKGTIRYSSNRDLVNQSDYRVRGLEKSKALPAHNRTTYYTPVFTVEYCTRCHPDWKINTVNSYYKLTLDRRALTEINNLSVYYNILIFFGGLIFLGFIYLLFDVVERRKNQEQLLLSASVFDNTVEGIAITDHTNRIQKVNAAFTQITQFSTEEAIGQSIHILNPDGPDKDTLKELQKGLKEDGLWCGEVWNRRKSGELFPAWLSVSAITNIQGKTTHYVSLFHDITDIKRTQDRLEYQAYHDALTGLPNRQLFQDRMEMTVAHAHRNQEQFAVIFIDLDNFKNVNDCHGHQVGDLFLKEVSRRLKLCCRDLDTIARIGGDEFTIILPDIKNSNQVLSVIRRILRDLEKPFLLAETELYSGASIGITLYPEDGVTPETLIKNADMAMYRAKQQGKGTYVFYTEKITASVLRRINLEKGLRNALRKNEFLLHYQPVLDTTTETIVGCEALIRWQPQPGEIIPPNEFIPLSEESDLASSIGDWVIEEACCQLAAWRRAGFENFSVAVNLSSTKFREHQLAENIDRILRQHNLPASALHVELTETTVMEDVAAAKENMGKLHEMGIGIVLDDFGTGYSSLSYLKQFPLDIIKIDRSFVRELVDNPSDQAVARSIINLCHELGMGIVAEGIEKKEQLEFFRRHGCKKYQGFLYSKPVAAAEFTALLQQQKIG